MDVSKGQLSAGAPNQDAESDRIRDEFAGRCEAVSDKARSRLGSHTWGGPAPVGPRWPHAVLPERW